MDIKRKKIAIWGGLILGFAILSNVASAIPVTTYSYYRNPNHNEYMKEIITIIGGYILSETVYRIENEQRVVVDDMNFKKSENTWILLGGHKKNIYRTIIILFDL